MSGDAPSPPEHRFGGSSARRGRPDDRPLRPIPPAFLLRLALQTSGAAPGRHRSRARARPRWPIASGIPPRALQGRLTLNPTAAHRSSRGAGIHHRGLRMGQARSRERVQPAGIRSADMALIAAAGPLVESSALAFAGVWSLLRRRSSRSGLLSVTSRVAAHSSYVYPLQPRARRLQPDPAAAARWRARSSPNFLPRASVGPSLHKLEQCGPISLILAVLSGATRYVVRPAMDLVGALFDFPVAAHRLSTKVASEGAEKNEDARVPRGPGA